MKNIMIELSTRPISLSTQAPKVLVDVIAQMSIRERELGFLKYHLAGKVQHRWIS